MKRGQHNRYLHVNSTKTKPRRLRVFNEIHAAVIEAEGTAKTLQIKEIVTGAGR